MNRFDYDGLDRIPSGTFDLVILDEAQRIKNKNSTTALACPAPAAQTLLGTVGYTSRKQQRRSCLYSQFSRPVGWTRAS